jgi:hypothetical protein
VAGQPVDESSLGQLTGIAGAPVRTVTAAGLTAIVGDVPLHEFGEQALHRNLEDLAWLEETARAHHRVIEAVARQVPVVPARLATVYHGDAGVADMLAERGADLRVALGRIDARREWGVKAYAAQPPGPGDPGPAASGGPARPAAGPGAAYLQRRRDQLSGRQNARRAALQSAEILHTRLSRLAAETRMHPPQAPQLTGSKAPMILNASYLLDEQRADDFAAEAAALAEQHPAIRVELTGPWPPYSFAGAAEGERPA